MTSHNQDLLKDQEGNLIHQDKGYQHEISHTLPENLHKEDVNQMMIDQTLTFQWLQESQEQTTKEENEKVGLKNVGNTCYFNSLIQFYFSIPNFVQIITNYQQQKNITDEKILQRIELINSLAKTFSQLAFSEQSYIDPSLLISNIKDDFGKKIIIEQQSDIGEFNLQFIEMLEQGLSPIFDQQANQEQEKQLAEENVNQLPGLIPQLSKSKSIGPKHPQNILMKTLSNSRAKTIPHQQKGEIENIFYGTWKQEIFYQEENIKKSDFTLSEFFIQINLDINQQDFYSAIDVSLQDEMNDFTTPLGNKTKGQKNY